MSLIDIVSSLAIFAQKIKACRDDKPYFIFFYILGLLTTMSHMHSTTKYVDLVFSFNAQIYKANFLFQTKLKKDSCQYAQQESQPKFTINQSNHLER